MSDYKIHFDWESYPKLRITDDLLINSATITIDTALNVPSDPYKVMVRNSVSGVVEAVDPSDVGSSVTADNGLIAASNNVQLGDPTPSGAPLLYNTYIDAQGYFLRINGNTNQYTFNVLTAGNSGIAIQGDATGNGGVGIRGTTGNFSNAKGVYGISTSGTGVYGQATSGVGILGVANSGGVGINAQSIEGLPSEFIGTWASGSTVETMIRLRRFVSTTPSDGIGGSVDFVSVTTDGVDLFEQPMGKIYMDFTDVTDSTRTSEFGVELVNSTSTSSVLTISGAGQYISPQGFQDFADDTAAATGGIPVNGWYRTGSVIKIRVT